MSQVNPQDLWFNLPDSPTLCRGGSNGPAHPSQLYAIKKYLKTGMSFLDYGAGSATTYEALKKDGWSVYSLVTHPTIFAGKLLIYRGLDIIEKNTKWCQENFPGGDFKYNPILHKIDEPDKSFDVVYSRHVVDHMESFEKALDEHKRVAKKLVIVILWTGLIDGDEHQIKNITRQWWEDSNGEEVRHDTPGAIRKEQTYPNEYTNYYSRKKVLEYLNNDPEWELLEFNEDVGNNQVIVLRRKNV